MRITGARATARDAGRCVVEITCDGDPRRGSALADASVAPGVTRLAAEILASADPCAVAANYAALRAADDQAHSTLGPAVAALDCALWDLKAQIEGVALWRSLGALAPRVRVHARVDASSGDGSMESVSRALATRGLRSAVFASTLDAGRDAARLGTARAALGPDATLMLDLGERLSAKEAVNHVCRVEREVDLAWVEAPAARADFPGLRRVSDAIRAAVCAGRHHRSPGDYLPALHARAIDIVQVDLDNLGISGALQVADAAFGLELPVALTAGSAALALQVAAALPYCAGIEIGVDEPLPIHSGFAGLAA